MIIGGSTTSLLSLLSSLDPEKYEIDLQLYRNEGPLLDIIPRHVNLLPEADICHRHKSRLLKAFKFVTSGYAFKYLFNRILSKKKRASGGVVGDFQVKVLSKRNPKHYDFAIGFMEGWSDKYVAYRTSADTKYAWIHSTFSKISSDTEPPEWMLPFKKIIFVADSCKKQFSEQIIAMADRAVTIENITDSGIISKRAEERPGDAEFERFIVSGAFKIVTVCRLTVRVKGLDRIVACAKRLKASGIKFLWYIIGDGEDKQRLLDMISGADLGDCLVPIGKRLNPYPYVEASDIMCMPSRYEGKPMVITEAMILGTPPVVTEYLSANEHIRNGVDGIIVPNNDTSIFDAVFACCTNKDLVHSMKAALSAGEYGNRNYINHIEKVLFEEL